VRVVEVVVVATSTAVGVPLMMSAAPLAESAALMSVVTSSVEAPRNSSMSGAESDGEDVVVVGAMVVEVVAGIDDVDEPDGAVVVVDDWVERLPVVFAGAVVDDAVVLEVGGATEVVDVVVDVVVEEDVVVVGTTVVVVVVVVVVVWPTPLVSPVTCVGVDLLLVVPSPT